MMSPVPMALVLLCGATAIKPDVGSEAQRHMSLIKTDIRDLSDMEATAVFPVPTTSRCIVIMVCQYMIIYTALAVARTYFSCYYSQALVRYKTRGLIAAAQTMQYAPMLCVLFIACRMRVEFLSKGKGEPQQWVQNCMYALTFAVLASSLVVLLMPLFSGKPISVKDGMGDIEMPGISPRFATSTWSQITYYTLTVARYLILLALYGGLIGVIVGINIYLPPGETHLSNVPSPAPAVMCTMVLSVIFFVTQLIIAVCQTYTEFFGVDFYAGHVHKIIQVMNGAAHTIEFAPMLAIVFLAARMRALQHNGQPQEWAQNCMYAATGSLCFTTFMAILVPCCLTGAVQKANPTTKEVTFEVPSQTLGYIMLALRFACMIGFYAGVGGVIYSIFVFEAPAGTVTQPVSPTVQCVVTLTCQFFFVYAGLIVCLTIQELTGGQIPLETYKFYSAIEAAKSTLPFAPMLAILFVTTRMYALLLTDKQGAPQAWVQDGMYMATYSLLISFTVSLIAGLLVDKVEQDEDGNILNKFSIGWVSMAMTALRYFTMLLLYGGILTVIVGLFVMTPETANGRGSVPVLSDAINSTPLGHAPGSLSGQL